MRINKKFIDSVKSIVNAGQIRYSADINKQLKNGETTQQELASLLAKFTQKDFGNIEPERARRFGNHMDVGDKDVYGVYGDKVIYYDASRDQLTVLSRHEFTSYYTIDWTETDRRGFRERYDPAKRQIGKSMPTDPTKQESWRESMLKEQRVLTEGQQRETSKVAREQAEELFGENPAGMRNFLRYEWKVWPEEDYTEFVKHFDEKLGRDKRMNLVNLAKEYGVSVKKIYAIIMYYYQVQRKPLEAGYDYIMKNLGDKRKAGMFTSDSRKE